MGCFDGSNSNSPSTVYNADIVSLRKKLWNLVGEWISRLEIRVEELLIRVDAENITSIYLQTPVAATVARCVASL